MIRVTIKVMIIYLATNNNHKVQEIREILGNAGVSLQGAPQGFDVHEDGATYEENAIKKAQALSRQLNVVAVADDSGLEVEALGNGPGIRSARYAPTSQERIEKLLKNLEGEKNRRARFVCVIALAYPSGEVKTFYGECDGVITEAPSGGAGFGYDPVFYLPEYGKTMAELEPSVKNKISHRAVALARAMEYLKSAVRV